jgi:Na+/glutamate symporter
LTRSRYFASVMPIYAILYVIGILTFDHNSKFVTIGAMGFALLAVIGAVALRPEPGTRNRHRDRNRPS